MVLAHYISKQQVQGWTVNQKIVGQQTHMIAT